GLASNRFSVGERAHHERIGGHNDGTGIVGFGGRDKSSPYRLPKTLSTASHASASFGFARLNAPAQASCTLVSLVPSTNLATYLKSPQVLTYRSNKSLCISLHRCCGAVIMTQDAAGQWLLCCRSGKSIAHSRTTSW